MKLRSIARVLGVSAFLCVAPHVWSQEENETVSIPPETPKTSPQTSEGERAAPADPRQSGGLPLDGPERGGRPDGPGGPGGFFDGPGGPGGFFGGPGGRRGGPGRKTKLVDRFDEDGDGRLNADERKAARASLEEERQRGRGRGRRGFGRFPGRDENADPPRPGAKLAPSDVEWFPDVPLYDAKTLRTLFLEFESSDWEEELAAFNDTDVEVPATLTVDGKVYPDVGVRFRGMTSFMTVGKGRKRPLNLSLNSVHKNQRLGGYRTLNLLNSHEDPTFLRTVLYSRIARAYIPAPAANFVRVVINGESWGVYVNAQQFNKDLARDWFGTKKGARWKVPGSPGGRGSLAYLGDDAEAYKGIYSIRSKDKPESWKALIELCRVLNETPADQLQKAVEPLLDIDGALRFLALENTLVNNDGYWIRTSDYNLYRDTKGRFHPIPHDTNETFTLPGGPGFGRGRRGFARGPGGFGRFGRGMTTRAMMVQADKDRDGRLTKDELVELANVWFYRLDAAGTGKLSRSEFVSRLGEALTPPRDEGVDDNPRDGASPGDSPRPNEFPGPDAFIREGIFTAADEDGDGTLTRSELKSSFAGWFDAWDGEKSGSLTEEQLARGLRETLPRPEFGGGRGRRGGRRGPRGFGGPEGFRGPGEFPGPEGFRGPRGGAGAPANLELDPLIAADDPSKPLISKLLAVPVLREKYLGYVRDIASKWLDWEKNLGPIAEEYQALIAEAVEADTRKLDSTEDFRRGLTEDTEGGGFGPRVKIGLKRFADERREYLLKRE